MLVSCHSPSLSPATLPVSQPWGITNVLFVSMDLAILDVLCNEVIEYVVFCDWFLSCIMNLKAHSYGSIYQYFIPLLPNNIPLYTYARFVYPFIC